MNGQIVAVGETQRASHLQSFLLLVVFGALGALLSVPVGYAGSFLNSLALFPLAVPQLLSGLHVFWLVLVALLVPQCGSATATGALKGFIEASLFSHLSVFSFLVSLAEGVAVDLVFVFLKKERAFSVYAAGGLSSASNLIILQLFFLPSLPVLVYAVAYFASFLSGLLFGGYLTTKVLRVIPANLLK